MMAAFALTQLTSQFLANRIKTCYISFDAKTCAAEPIFINMESIAHMSQLFKELHESYNKLESDPYYGVRLHLFGE